MYVLEIELDLKFTENMKIIFVLQSVKVHRIESREDDLNEVIFELNLKSEFGVRQEFGQYVKAWQKMGKYKDRRQSHVT